MIAAIVGFTRSWGERFLDVQGVDRAVAIAAQAFSALIPLLIVYSAVVSRDSGEGFATGVIDRFDLEGSTADSVRRAFTSPDTVTDSISMFGLLLLIVSALSFSRGMQRVYESAYRLPSLGMRNTRWGLAWLGLLVLYSSVRPFAAGLFDGPVVTAAVSLALGTAAWTATPYLLLGRRIGWKPLLPGAVLADVGITALAVSSVVWFPRTIESSAAQFGVMGVAFALLSWLVAAGFVVVAAATGGAVLTEQLRDRSVRRT
jgi:membrane protein